SVSGVSDSSGSFASIGQLIPFAPSDSFKLFAEGDVKTMPLLAAPTDRLWPVPTTPSQRGSPPPSTWPPSPLLVPPPPQPNTPAASAAAQAQIVNVVSPRIARESRASRPVGKPRSSIARPA